MKGIIILLCISAVSCAARLKFGQQSDVPAGFVQVIQSSLAGDRFAQKPSVPIQSSPNNNSPYTSGTVYRSIKLDASNTFQEIHGFGGAFTEAAGYNLKKMSPSKQAEIVAAYFGSPDESLGYSLCRTHINSCDFCLDSYSCDDVAGDYELRHFNIDHDHEYILPFLKAAVNLTDTRSDRKFKLFASPWSPPAWMKGNGQMDGSSTPGLIDDPQVHQAWAKFMSEFVSAYQAQGIPFWGLTVQNEPANAAAWEACVYTPQQERDFIKQYLGPQIRKDHPELKIMMWDHNRDIIAEWAQIILSDPEAAQYVDGIAFHWYTGNSPGLNMYDNLDAARAVDPSKFLLASEATYCPGVRLGDWSRGEAYGVDILNDLNHWTTGWVDWNMVLDLSGGPNHLHNECDAPIIVDPDQDIIHYQPTYYFMGHFSKYLDPGAVRISTELNQTQVCMANPSADANSVCGALGWACSQGGISCPGNFSSCDPSILMKNANRAFNSYYQQHLSEGPSACVFGGVASLEGVQVTSFQRPDGSVAVVLVNVGERTVSYQVSLSSDIIHTSMPPRSIQTLLWPSKQV